MSDRALCHPAIRTEVLGCDPAMSDRALCHPAIRTEVLGYGCYRLKRTASCGCFSSSSSSSGQSPARVARFLPVLHGRILNPLRAPRKFVPTPYLGGIFLAQSSDGKEPSSPQDQEDGDSSSSSSSSDAGSDIERDGDEAERRAQAEAGMAEERQISKSRFWQIFRLGFRKPDTEEAAAQKPIAAAANGTASLNIAWRDILDPTPENLLALLLTGLLGLAILQIFWQLLLVSITITLAALKYSVIAAILLALLIVFL